MPAREEERDFAFGGPGGGGTPIITEKQQKGTQRRGNLPEKGRQIGTYM